MNFSEEVKMAKLVVGKQELAEIMNTIPSGATIGHSGYSPVPVIKDGLEEVKKGFTFAHFGLFAKMKMICDYTIISLYHLTPETNDDMLQEQIKSMSSVAPDIPVDFIYLCPEQYSIQISRKLFTDTFSENEENYNWYKKNTDIFAPFNIDSKKQSYHHRFLNYVVRSYEPSILPRVQRVISDLNDVMGDKKYVQFKGAKDYFGDFVMISKVVGSNYPETSMATAFTSFQFSSYLKRMYLNTIYWPNKKAPNFGGYSYSRKENHIFNLLDDFDYKKGTIEQLRSIIENSFAQEAVPEDQKYLILSARTGKMATTEDVRNRMAVVGVYSLYPPPNDDVSLLSYEPRKGEWYWIGLSFKDCFEIDYSSGVCEVKQIIDNSRVEDIISDVYNRIMPDGKSDIEINEEIKKEIKKLYDTL